ncbi:MAG: hypothetical protein IJ199_02685 [Prevotella sp.]|nr:hypothetical protein [Prevotella sp.]
MKQTFNLILALALWLMAQTAWAATKTETRTATWYMDGGASGNTNVQGTHVLNSGGMTLEYKNNNTATNTIYMNSSNNQVVFRLNIISCGGFLEFTNLQGTVKKVEFTNVRFYNDMQMYVGKDKNDNSTLLHVAGNASDYDFPSIDSQEPGNATFEGSLAVSPSSPLRIMFSSSNSETSGYFGFRDGTIVVTYDVEVENTDDPGHSFTFAANASSDAIIATCTEGSAYHNCGLTNRQVTMPFEANDVPYDGFRHYASLNQTAFNNAGITNIAAILSYKDKSTNETLENPPAVIGSYTATASVTVTYKETAHPFTLTKDFDILAGFKVNNNYSQFSVSKISALEGDEVTITYTQLMDEILEGLTLTGATSGNNIAYTQSGNTYTFNMPAEDVNLSATFTYPLNENNITQSGDTYTIKTAEGWNYFCQRLEVDGDLNGFSGKTVMLGDNITVTTMAGMVHPFKGTFDGNGHTLTFSHTADRSNCAPFRITNGATIRNLHATGLIEGGIWHNMGGLVGSASGNLTIENCHVSTRISSTINGEAGHGGIVGYVQYTNYLVDCNITGCVYDGLIYNSNTWNQTYGCGGFVGAMSQYAYVDLTDCLFLHGQYDNNGNKCELYWGYDNDRNSTFFHRSNGYGEGKLTNCFYVGTRGLKQGSPAVESADAPDNFAHFGTPTDHGFLKVYGHTMVFDGKYYTPTYGDLVEKYDYSGVKSYNIEYDDAPLGIPDITSPLWTESLRYNRSFTAGKPVTIMLPFNFKRDRTTLAGSNENPSGKFYEFKGIEEDQDHKWVAVMIEASETLSNEVVETTLQANHPYLYVPGESTVHWAMYVSGGINIFTEGDEGGNKQTEYDGTADFAWNKWNFIGTYQPRYWNETEHFEEVGKVYGFAGATKEVDEQLVVAGDFVRVKSGAKIRPTSCYLMWAGSEPATTDSNGAKASGMSGTASVMNELPQTITVRLVDANGETTGIGEIDTKTGEVFFDSEAWYTIDGIRLDGKPAKSGMYINNGKKVMIE